MKDLPVRPDNYPLHWIEALKAISRSEGIDNIVLESMLTRQAASNLHSKARHLLQSIRYYPEWDKQTLEALNRGRIGFAKRQNVVGWQLLAVRRRPPNDISEILQNALEQTRTTRD